MRNSLLLLFFIAICPYFSSQIIYEGDGFNYKQYLQLNSDKTFKYKSLSAACMDSEYTLIESNGTYFQSEKTILLNYADFIVSKVPFYKDSLTLGDELIDVKKNIIKTEKYNDGTKREINYYILQYKDKQFLMEDYDDEYVSTKEQFLEFSDNLNQDNERINIFISSKLHFSGHFNTTKNQLINLIPKKYKFYFTDKPISLKVINYTEKTYRDPTLILEVPDEEAMLYEYEIQLDKGTQHGIFMEMKIYPQQDLNNCNYDFHFTKIGKNSSTGKLGTSSKCNLNGNFFSTKFRLK
ncbi:hypothetical protein [Chryseobacterium sp. Leaf394]|uniref:hypothetical protein n=1 Tax=Chryseobacterium sp. Leaf394 TaxID=1736361 RepID=UPI0006FD938C|nr:hypothetical protein [Chryseobacterium sp. Leaf394]KQS92008.1 hypothetical protein ASG21_06005 [Chryseobacterium sp. Leaf394]